ncbi:cytidylyltransferase domain-containing protein [Cohnella massiliensis]|uniref:cytidylyltransferase domain-containing protein n=1 Tax=Cohnella massiliensis TaxID=1816691 RepID=UPI0009B999FC|nr:glycosyltransferase family protein [Cohnella massiliensis]
MKSIIIIQARMGSARLPGKILMPLGDTTVLDYVVSRCKQVRNVSEVIVATSVLPQDEAVAEWCNLHNVSFFRGSEDDVLSRYVEAAKPHQPDCVIRVTGDCPFVDYQLTESFIRAMEQSPADLVVWEGALPRGLVAEVLTFDTLLRIDKEGQEPRHREHVTYYAHEFPGKYSRTVVPLPQNLRYPNLRITLDTKEDYALCQAIASAFPEDKLVPSADVVAYLNAHPEIAQLNGHIEQKPVV